jgi:hypothetical protein
MMPVAAIAVMAVCGAAASLIQSVKALGPLSGSPGANGRARGFDSSFQ